MTNTGKPPRSTDPRPPDRPGDQPSANRSPGPGAHILPSRAERRPEMIRQGQQERPQAYERGRRQWLLTRIGLGVVAVLIVAALGYIVYAGIQGSRVPEGTREFAVSAGHTAEPVAYDPAPPVGGEHDSPPQTCGFYAAPVRSENAVHSLEHGAVWITYRPDLPADQVDRLRTLAEDEGKILVSPFADLPAPVVASSWGRQIRLDSAEDNRLRQFVQRFRADAPEHSAPCIGVGTPM